MHNSPVMGRQVTVPFFLLLLLLVVCWNRVQDKSSNFVCEAGQERVLAVDIMPSVLDRLRQAWFTLVIFSAIVWFRIGTALVQALKGITRETDAEASHTCTVWGCFVFKMALRMCPWIHVTSIDRKPLHWPVKASPPPFFLMNHTSFMDFFVFTVSMPLRLYRETSFRTMVQAKLFQFALYGEGMKACGTFPVHFAKDEAGVFQVDKEKQAKVTEDVNAHIVAGGSIGLCPEGQISRHPPTPLQSFRRGSFAIPTENSMPIWGFTMLGCHESWPLSEPIGGLPATIYCSIDHLYTPKKDDQPAEVAEICQKKMQEVLDRLVAHRDSVNAKESKKTA